MPQWKIGCSGYHYAEWKRIFYPDGLPQRKWFEYYSEHFNTLELNVTFYRFPKPAFLKTWYERSPENFKFSVKAPRLITHYKKLQDAQHALFDFYTVIKNGLNEKLGCVLFQFPSAFVYEDHRLERILNLMDPSINNVVEFRHPSWWKQEVYDAFAKHNIIFCGMSHPNLPEAVVKTTNKIYYRFHGVPHLYWSKYEVQKIEQIASEIQNFEGVDDVYIYFNNTADGAAIVNAKQLQEYCEVVPRT